MQIICTVLGLTETDALQYEIELHLRRNYNITRLVKSTPSNLDHDNKYLTKDRTGKHRATVHLYVNSKYMYIIFIPLISSLRFSKCIYASYEKLQPVWAEKNNQTCRLCHLFECHKVHVNISKMYNKPLRGITFINNTGWNMYM